MVQFTNEAFFPFDSHNNVVYSYKYLTTKEIFRTVSIYTDYFDDKADEIRKKKKNKRTKMAL